MYLRKIKEKKEINLNNHNSNIKKICSNFIMGNFDEVNEDCLLIKFDFFF